MSFASDILDAYKVKEVIPISTIQKYDIYLPCLDEKEAYTCYSRLANEKKWDTADVRYILNHLDCGYGYFLDNYFWGRPCYPLYTFVRIQWINRKDITAAESWYNFTVYTIPARIGGFLMITVPIVIGLLAFKGLTSFIV